MEADEEELDLQLTTAATAHAADGTIDVSDVAVTATDNGAQRAEQARKLDQALKELETEPADAAACQSKFELYEGFAKLTEDARKAVYELWAGAQADLDAANAPSAKAQIARELAAVDRADHLGIADEPHRWFVHGMCRAACNNQRRLDNVLHGITTKLELLASQSECPICLEALDDTRPATTLGCAHKVCVECWGHWSTLDGRSHVGICPLCRHEEFLSAVLSAARA